MTLAKAFDPSALIAALKAKGIQDAEQLVNDELPVIFDWLNSSVAIEATTIPLLAMAAPFLTEIEAKVTAAVQAEEAKITGTAPAAT